MSQMIEPSALRCGTHHTQVLVGICTAMNPVPLRLVLATPYEYVPLAELLPLVSSLTLSAS